MFHFEQQKKDQQWRKTKRKMCEREGKENCCRSCCCWWWWVFCFREWIEKNWEELRRKALEKQRLHVLLGFKGLILLCLPSSSFWFRLVLRVTLFEVNHSIRSNDQRRAAIDVVVCFVILFWVGKKERLKCFLTGNSFNQFFQIVLRLPDKVVFLRLTLKTCGHRSLKVVKKTWGDHRR